MNRIDNMLKNIMGKKKSTNNNSMGNFGFKQMNIGMPKLQMSRMNTGIPKLQMSRMNTGMPKMRMMNIQTPKVGMPKIGINVRTPMRDMRSQNKRVGNKRVCDSCVDLGRRVNEEPWDEESWITPDPTGEYKDICSNCAANRAASVTPDFYGEREKLDKKRNDMSKKKYKEEVEKIGKDYAGYYLEERHYQEHKTDKEEAERNTPKHIIIRAKEGRCLTCGHSDFAYDNNIKFCKKCHHIWDEDEIKRIITINR